MLRDHKHTVWTSQELGEDFKDYFEGSFNLCEQILKDTDVTIKELEACLAKHQDDTGLSATSKAKSQKFGREFIRNFNTKAGVVLFNERQCEGMLADLRNRNDGLHKLRVQLSAFHKQRSRALRDQAQSHHAFKVVQRASQILFDSWLTLWCCKIIPILTVQGFPLTWKSVIAWKCA